MTVHRVITTDAQIDEAIARAKALANEPRVTSVTYRPGRGLDLLILQMSDGHRCVLPREDLQGLQGATRQQVAQVQILGGGTGLHWPDLDVDLYVPALLQGAYGTRKWMARIGSKGGVATSPAKRRASRANGRMGGRPKRRQSSVAA
jgi:hypothetical protein